jgi:imidazolonepropionase-like amidohydrolase
MQGGVIVDLTRVSTDEPALTDRAQSVANQCIVNAEGHVVTAGFWNTHVHFTDPVLTDDGQAAALIDEMLLSRGFTSVLDTGADPRVIDRLRTAIEVGTMLGPRIVVAGGSFVYTNGTPAYLPKGLLPELTEPAHAGPAVERVLDAGADGIKIFSGSFQTPSHTIYLPGDVIAAITNAAHARGAFVVSHPTDRQGLLNAVDNGVDILAHTAPPAGVLELDLLTRMRDRKVALTPTLKIWRWELERHGVPASAVESYITRGVAQLRDYHALGGEVLFGTDVGYMLDYDPTEEYVLMARAGLDFRAILQTLTVNPGARFARPGTPAGVGTVAVGQAADLVVLAGDPAADVRAFATPLVTIRGGQLVSDRR